MSSLGMKLFLAFGGITFVWKMIGSNARTWTHQGLGKLFTAFPIAKSFFIANRERIEALFDAVDAGAKDAIDEAAQPESPKV